MKNIKLIKGEFTPELAKKIVISLLDDKIKFHAVKIFSDTEKGITFGVDESKLRYKELKKQRNELIEYFDGLDSNVRLSISSFIDIQINS